MENYCLSVIKISYIIQQLPFEVDCGCHRQVTGGDKERLKTSHITGTSYRLPIRRFGTGHHRLVSRLSGSAKQPFFLLS